MRKPNLIAITLAADAYVLVWQVSHVIVRTPQHVNVETCDTMKLAARELLEDAYITGQDAEDGLGFAWRVHALMLEAIAGRIADGLKLDYADIRLYLDDAYDKLNREDAEAARAMGVRS